MTGASVALLLAVIPAVWWGRLPDPLASHWSVSGEPDGSMPKAMVLALPFVLWAVALLFARRMPPLVAGLGVLAVLLQGMTVWANLDRTDWQDARSMPIWMAVALVVLVLLAGWAGTRFTRIPAAPAAPVETLDLPEGERAVWVSRCTNPLLLTAGSLALAGGAVMLLVGRLDGAVVSALLVIGVTGMLLSSIRVRVGEKDVSVAYGPWGFPVWRRRLTKITAARVEDLSPSQVGGWGLRGLPPRTTLMLRGGECLVLEYPNGGRFAISVDGAAGGAALINTLKNR